MSFKILMNLFFMIKLTLLKKLQDYKTMSKISTVVIIFFKIKFNYFFRISILKISNLNLAIHD
tara:strand:+ start:243 stop:431 length:189 start_codon:yes stop_codon:yes gene_type:complete